MSASRSERNEVNKDSVAAMWRRKLFRLNIVISAIVLIVEVAVFFLLYFQGLIVQTISEYIFWYLLVPTVQNCAALCFQFAVFRLFPKNQEVQSYAIVLTC